MQYAVGGSDLRIPRCRCNIPDRGEASHCLLERVHSETM